MPSTTLRRRLTVQIVVMVSGVLLMGAGALWGLNRVHENLDATVRGFRQLRSLYEIGYFVSTAQASLQQTSPDEPRAQSAVQSALGVLNSPDVDSDRLPLSQWQEQTISTGDDLQHDLQQAIAGLDHPERDAHTDALLERALRELRLASDTLRQNLADQQQLAAAQRDFSLAFNFALAASLTIAAIWVGIRQYRTVMGPLDRLGAAVRRIARGEFEGRVQPDGDREFARLAEDFNQMASELQGLYHQLEQKVESKSKELIRSERLASLGYLAAGVAHEINNPLGIIAGYGERSLQRLEGNIDDAKLLKITEALRIMCEEAFRCKQITARLLQLARSGNEKRETISLLELTRRVIVNVGGLPHFEEKQIQLQANEQESFDVLVSSGEIKQVLTNLLVNALESNGDVRVILSRQEREIKLSVTDTGRGMTSETLERVFEPFFTEKRTGRGGTGLGLSITHAIVEDHGGRITAHSDGLGRGSTFVVSLPAATVGAGYVCVND